MQFADDYEIIHSFPTRRSSDLHGDRQAGGAAFGLDGGAIHLVLGRRTIRFFALAHPGDRNHADRKSTRLNSSHMSISYAVFCLKNRQATVMAVKPENLFGLIAV